MADIKFSELSTLAASDVASADVIAIVDTSETTSKQLSIDNLFGAVPVNITSNANIYVRDSGLSLSSPTDGTLDIAADTILEITAPTMNVISTTVDFDANVVIHSTFSANSTVMKITGATEFGVDDTGHDISIFGATADSLLFWDESDNALEFGNSFITMTDARTTGTMDVRGITIDISNKLDTGASNDRIGIDCDVIGDVNGYTIRDAVAIRAVSRQSTGAEVTRLNTPIHAVLDMANTASANNTGTTLSGAYGLAIDHDDTIATRTGQPTAFISFGELYVGGTASIETAYLFDIFPEGKTGDATYGTAADLSFYDDAAIIAAERDAVILNSTDGSPATDAGDLIVLETIDGDAYTPSRILEESHTDVNLNAGMPDQYNYIIMESNGDKAGDGTTPYIMLDTVAESGGILDTEGGKLIFEDGTQSADGTIKIRINGEDKYIQVYNTY